MGETRRRVLLSIKDGYYYGWSPFRRFVLIRNARQCPSGEFKCLPDALTNSSHRLFVRMMRRRC